MSVLCICKSIAHLWGFRCGLLWYYYAYQSYRRNIHLRFRYVASFV